MTDMPRQQYLSKDNKGWKLRRRVPEKLRDVIGMTQWVERLAGVSHREACERAKTFGIRTDAEIKRYEGQLSRTRVSSPPPKQNAPGFTLELTDHEIDQIAIAYFHELEKGVQSSGGYT